MFNLIHNMVYFDKHKCEKNDFENVAFFLLLIVLRANKPGYNLYITNCLLYINRVQRSFINIKYIMNSRNFVGSTKIKHFVNIKPPQTFKNGGENIFTVHNMIVTLSGTPLKNIHPNMVLLDLIQSGMIKN